MQDEHARMNISVAEPKYIYIYWLLCEISYGGHSKSDQVIIFSYLWYVGKREKERDVESAMTYGRKIWVHERRMLFSPQW